MPTFWCITCLNRSRNNKDVATSVIMLHRVCVIRQQTVWSLRLANLATDKCQPEVDSRYDVSFLYVLVTKTPKSGTGHFCCRNICALSGPPQLGVVLVSILYYVDVCRMSNTCTSIMLWIIGIPQLYLQYTKLANKSVIETYFHPHLVCLECGKRRIYFIFLPCCYTN